MKRLWAPIGLLILVATAVYFAQRPAPMDHLPGLKSDYFKVRAQALGRPLHIYVRLPEGYGAGEETYPAVYLLDGDILFPILGAYHYLLSFDEPAPDAIIVGVAYGAFKPENGNYRNTDFSVPPLDNSDRDGDPQGGAAAFHRFIKSQLIPEIERRYRANPERRILMGQSRGGDFTLYSAYTDPDLFWGRIASNPALSPNQEFFFEPFPESSAPSSNLFISSGSRDWEQLRADALKLFDHLEDAPNKPWRLNTVTLEGETHTAGITNVYRQAMLWLFDEEPNKE